MEVFEFRA